MQFILKRYAFPFLFLLLYTISFGANLLNNGLFWDDLLLYNSTISQMFEEISRLGNPFSPYLYLLIKVTESLFISKLITFFAYFLSGYFLFRILRLLKYPTEFIYYIVLLFTLVPINFARNLLCVTHYAVSYCLFYCSVY